MITGFRRLALAQGLIVDTPARPPGAASLNDRAASQPQNHSHTKDRFGSSTGYPRVSFATTLPVRRSF